MTCLGKPPRVGFHRFSTYAGHPGADGANLAYRELTRLLQESPEVVARPHDILRLCADDAAARAELAHCDVVVATVGPHAYLYFYFRERFGLRYRIVWDVRTALWNGYFLQESLVAPYVRTDDVAVHSTVFSRALFGHIFSHVPAESQHVCYPLLRWFPREMADSWRQGRRKGPYVIGFVGRLTRDKNFEQALDLLAVLRRRHPGRFELHCVGQGSGKYGDDPTVLARLGGDPTAYRWTPTVARGDVWKHYAEFDVLFFPSTSNLETFGRVLAEASYVGVPILASTHGATTELLAPLALLPTRYDTTTRFSMHFAAPLGEVHIEHAADQLGAGVAPPRGAAHEPYLEHDRRFLSIVVKGPEARDSMSTRAPTVHQKGFIGRVQLTGLDRQATPAASDTRIEELRRRFLALHRRMRPDYWLTLAELLAKSQHRRKTLEFIRRSVLRNEDFTNIGGLDLQFAHLLKFYPSFAIRPAKASSANSFAAGAVEPAISDTSHGPNALGEQALPAISTLNDVRR